jgi:hypothetical protein
MSRTLLIISNTHVVSETSSLCIPPSSQIRSHHLVPELHALALHMRWRAGRGPTFHTSNHTAHFRNLNTAKYQLIVELGGSTSSSSMAFGSCFRSGSSGRHTPR